MSRVLLALLAFVALTGQRDTEKVTQELLRALGDR